MGLSRRSEAWLPKAARTLAVGGPLESGLAVYQDMLW